jgi:hypothetical protein
MDRLRAGDWVQVKSAEAILATLDEDGCIDGLPFMPEMLEYCGRRFRVYKSAHKTCTPPSLVIRTLDDTFHLEKLRCSGAAHGGCQAGCLLFWKANWLTPVDAPRAPDPGPAGETAGPDPADVPPTVPEVMLRGTRRPPEPGFERVERYRCQSTDLVRATRPATWWHPRLLLRDVTSRNVRLRDWLLYGSLAAFNAALGLFKRRSYPFLRPRATGKTPTTSLGLQAGDPVRVRPVDEIMDTLDERKKNRGLRFDVEMWPHCGEPRRVLRRAEKFIDERSGRMIEPRGSCLILEEVVCSGFYSAGRMFCPREIYPFWHEVWLERREASAPEGKAHDVER